MQTSCATAVLHKIYQSTSDFMQQIVQLFNQHHTRSTSCTTRNVAQHDWSWMGSLTEDVVCPRSSAHLLQRSYVQTSRRPNAAIVHLIAQARQITITNSNCWSKKCPLLSILVRSRDLVTCYGLDGQGSIPCRGKSIFSSPQRPHQLCGSPSSYPMVTEGSFSRIKAAGAWNWPHLHLVPRWRMVDLYLHSPIHLHCTVLN
jgi:hypothetical protein